MMRRLRVLYEDTPLLNGARRTKALLWFGGIVFLLGWGARLWLSPRLSDQSLSSPAIQSDRALSQPPQGSLSNVHLFRVVLTKAQWASREKTLQIPLHLRGFPYAAEQPMKAEHCEWHIESFLHRSSVAEPWREYAIPHDSSAFLQTNSVHANLRIPALPGEWKVKIRAVLEYREQRRGTFWHSEAAQEFKTELSPSELTHIAAQQKALYLANVALNKPPKWANVLVKGKTYISKIQYQDAREMWQDVPTPGSLKYPMVVEENRTVLFRAVKADPRIEWPDYPEFLPQWEDNWRATAIGESVSSYFPLAGPEDKFQKVTVRCGNQISTQVEIVPHAEILNGESGLIFLSDKQDLAINSKSLGHTRLVAICNIYRTKREGAKAYLSASYADGSKADLINEAGAQDDAISLDTDGMAYATLKAGVKTGSIYLGARIITPNGRELSRSQQEVIVNVHAGWWATEHKDNL